MPRGNATETDQELLQRLSKFERPVTINDLVLRLKWSRGKIDGSIARLVDKEEIAVVNISRPKGQRQRFIGLPSRPYWQSFYEIHIIKQKSIIIYDSSGVIKPFLVQEPSSNSVNSSKNIDPEFSVVIDKYRDQIADVVRNREISSAEFLEKAIRYYLNPENAILAKNLVDVVAEAFKSDNDTAEKEAARSFVKRAQTMSQSGDLTNV